jgi:hypothetical protein
VTPQKDAASVPMENPRTIHRFLVVLLAALIVTVIAASIYFRSH